MEQLIRFRKLADLLSQNEFDLFIKTSNLDIRSLILKELFSLFHEEIQNDRNSSDLMETIHIISKIIESRNPKQLKDIELKQESAELSLNDLPSALIGECGSFLPFIDYNSLQNVSRSAFIGCNNPNTVTTIDRGIFRRHYISKQHLKLVTYKKVINFEIDIGNFSQMTAIHNLSLSQDTKSLLLYRANTETMKTFLNMKCLNFDKIEILKLEGYVDDINSFCNLLKCFKNTKFLGLFSCYFASVGFNSFKNSKCFEIKFNNLQGLALNSDQNVTFSEHLLHYFSDKLLSFHFSYIWDKITFPKNGFINLKEVCFGFADYNKINDIIKTAKKLERVHLGFSSGIIQNDNKLEDILLELFSQNTLEFVSIKINNDLKSIKNVLQKISFSKRKRLKIRFEITANIKNANEYLEILENKLGETGVIDDWMIIFIFIEAISKRVQLMRTNKECKINGWREKWLYHCRRCNI